MQVIVEHVRSFSGRRRIGLRPLTLLVGENKAALGSFFAELVAHHDRTVVLETHSDYLVDRVRQEVARGTLRADQVLILFFHKPKLETFVHEITLDDAGNVENAPPHYREFFMQEELNLFNRAGA